MNEDIVSVAYGIFALVCQENGILEEELIAKLSCDEAEVLEALVYLEEHKLISTVVGYLMPCNPESAKLILNENRQAKIAKLHAEILNESEKLEKFSELFHKRSEDLVSKEILTTSEDLNKLLFSELKSVKDKVLYMSQTGDNEVEVASEKYGRIAEIVSTSGSKIYTIAPKSLLGDINAHEFMDKAVNNKQQYRFVDNVLIDMCILDDKLAVIPHKIDEFPEAVQVIRDKGVIEFLTDVFWQIWQSTKSLELAGGVKVKTLADSSYLGRTEIEILAGLFAGMPHKAIAKKIDKTERTVRRRVSQLEEKYGVQSQIALGYQLAKAGVEIS